MRLETSKQRDLSKGLLEKAIEFHGHGGPFMVIGLRMGLLALRELDAHGWFDLRCRAKLHWNPPDSCVIDGIQSSSGCTMGKHNIEVEEQDGISAEFVSGEKSLSVALRSDVLERILGALAQKNEELTKSLISVLEDSPEEEVFDISLSDP
jgi:formylmethanofuran dehydrogenase subunit E